MPSRRDVLLVAPDFNPGLMCVVGTGRAVGTPWYIRATLTRTKGRAYRQCVPRGHALVCTKFQERCQFFSVRPRGIVVADLFKKKEAICQPA